MPKEAQPLGALRNNFKLGLTEATPIEGNCELGVAPVGTRQNPHVTASALEIFFTKFPTALADDPAQVRMAQARRIAIALDFPDMVELRRTFENLPVKLPPQLEGNMIEYASALSEESDKGKIAKNVADRTFLVLQHNFDDFSLKGPTSPFSIVTAFIIGTEVYQNVQEMDGNDTREILKKIEEKLYEKLEGYDDPKQSIITLFEAQMPSDLKDLRHRGPVETTLGLLNILAHLQMASEAADSFMMDHATPARIYGAGGGILAVFAFIDAIKALIGN